MIPTTMPAQQVITQPLQDQQPPVGAGLGAGGAVSETPVSMGGGMGVGGGVQSKPNSIEELTAKFAQIEESFPEETQNVIDAANSAGLSGPLLENLGILAVMAILDPSKYPDIRATMAQRYPQEVQNLPERYEAAEENLYMIAFAAYLQDGGQI